MQEPVETAEPSFVHATAIVEAGARVGEGSRIWHHAHVRDEARIGRGTQLGKNVYVDVGAVIGSRVKIQNNVSIYQGVTIEDDVFVGPSAVFTNDRVPRAFGSWHVSPTWIRRGASIGANATVICGTEIGEFSMVAAGAVVTQSVESHELVAGNPARHLGWVCECGTIVSRSVDRPADCRCAGCAQDPLDAH